MWTRSRPGPHGVSLEQASISRPIGQRVLPSQKARLVHITAMNSEGPSRPQCFLKTEPGPWRHAVGRSCGWTGHSEQQATASGNRPKPPVTAHSLPKGEGQAFGGPRQSSPSDTSVRLKPEPLQGGCDGSWMTARETPGAAVSGLTTGRSSPELSWTRRTRPQDVSLLAMPVTHARDPGTEPHIGCYAGGRARGPASR